MINVDQEFTCERECIYKGERYRVRDNGAILRMAREGMPIRPKDEKWTFGDKIEKGYAKFGSESVHRIVAVAFLGEPPTDQHVVDHIDTNRQNNRPENLRWVTKLENVLLNPITRAKIEYRCGSIENFLKNPSLLKDLGSEDERRFAWMRAVTPEEAQNTLENLKRLSSRPVSEIGNTRNFIDEWIFQQKTFNDRQPDIFAGLEYVKRTEISAPKLDTDTKVELTLPLQPVIPPMPTSVVERKPKDQVVTKTEYMKAFVRLCENEGWEYEKYYKGEGWQADILISMNNRRFAFSACKLIQSANKSLPLVEQDGITAYGLFLAPKGVGNATISCSCLHRNEETKDVAVSEKELPLDTLVKKAVEGKIIHETRKKIVAVDMLFPEINCWHCKTPHNVFYARYLVDENGKKHDCAHVDERNIPNLQFGTEILELVKRYIDEHPDKGIVMGDVKERYSKSVDERYMSFGCPKCDAMVGEFFLHHEMEPVWIYETDEKLMNRIQLKTPFEIPVNDLMIKD
ncbi:MAG: HNH endonuclease [Fibrobacter sp.]|nr:HNH endonuclease [Fibrobacter sp.]